MSNEFKHRPKKDNESALRVFIDKLFGKEISSMAEAGIVDAKEAFNSARPILRKSDNNTKTASEHKNKRYKSPENK